MSITQKSMFARKSTFARLLVSQKSKRVEVDEWTESIEVAKSGGGCCSGLGPQVESLDPSSWYPHVWSLRSDPFDLESVPQRMLEWIPEWAPNSGENFRGVDRSVDHTRLAGIRWVGLNQAMEEALSDAACLIDREGFAPTHVLMHPSAWSFLLNAQGHAAVLGRAGSPLVCFPEPGLPEDRCLVVTLDTWHLAYKEDPGKPVALWCSSPAGNATVQIYNPNQVRV